MSITAMNEYSGTPQGPAGKSFEELRWEDYQAGAKNAQSPVQPLAAAPAPAAGGFGSPAPSFSGFGQSPAPAFGQQSGGRCAAVLRAGACDLLLAVAVKQ